MRYSTLVTAMAAGLATAGCAATASQPASAVATPAKASDHQAGKVPANGIEIAYQVDGPADGEPLLFIVGLGGQMHDGLDPLTSALVGHGFRVIRFDNRDAGLSTHMTEAGAPPPPEKVIEAIKAGRRPPLAYTIVDMANDSLALMDALGIPKAHVVGGSMGGMIAQILAAQHPERVLSLTSVSSTSGNPEIPYGPAIAVLGKTAGVGGTEEEMLARKVMLAQAMEGSKYKIPPTKMRETIRAEMARSNDPLAISRQSMAVAPYADRRAMLRTIQAPTLVVQGQEDPIFPLAHAQDQIANIPGAKLEVLPGMGHTLPEELSQRLADLIAENAKRAR